MPDKRILITGGAQGIGEKLASALAARGNMVVVADVQDTVPAAERIKAAGYEALGIHCDVTDENSIQSMIERVRDTFGGLDGVVNNAALFGTLKLTSMMDLNIDEWDQVMAVNARGAWMVSKAAVPELVASGGGAIVNIATNRVFAGFPNMLHYDASKGAVVAMTRSMASELGQHNIRVNCIAPGLTMSENVLKKEGIEERAPLIAARRAIARDQQPEDLIGAVNFFLSEDAAFVTGQTLVVDGGGVLH